MPEPSELGRQIEAAFKNFAPDQSGHSQYVLRYQTNLGVPFVINRTTQSFARLWLPADDRFRIALEQKGFICHRSEPGSDTEHGTGRNSNLDVIPEFKGKPLFWTQAANPGQALEAASCIR